MGSLGDKLRAAQTVGLDSAIFIYHFEEHPRYKTLCAEAFDLMEIGAVRSATDGQQGSYHNRRRWDFLLISHHVIHVGDKRTTLPLLCCLG